MIWYWLGLGIFTVALYSATGVLIYQSNSHFRERVNKVFRRN